jgi:hypothetical protein
MVERIERLSTTTEAPAVRATTREGRATELFLTGPAEFLCSQVATLLAGDPAWRALFGDYIDGYKRMDYSQRALPALRVYNNEFAKTSESWYVEGDLIADIIFPASIRRGELEQLPDTVAGALLQQFRRVSFFNAVNQVVPGLNELGKRFAADKTLAFELSGDELVPLVQLRINFRIDLAEWDRYAEEDYRTKDQPFIRDLADLRRILNTVEGLNDDGSVNVTLKDAP